MLTADTTAVLFLHGAGFVSKITSCFIVVLRKNVCGTGRQKQRRVYRNAWRQRASTWSSVSFLSVLLGRDAEIKTITVAD